MGILLCEIAKQATAKNVVIITHHALQKNGVNVNFLMGSYPKNRLGIPATISESTANRLLKTPLLSQSSDAQGVIMNEQDHKNDDIIDAEALAVYEPPNPVEFSAELFSTYLVPNSFNDELDFSAYGLEHIAAELGYSITEQTILSETDTHCLMQAKGQCVRTERTSVATCRQPKQEKRHGKLVA